MKKLAHKRKVIGPRSRVRAEAELDKNAGLITPNPMFFPFVHGESLYFSHLSVSYCILTRNLGLKLIVSDQEIILTAYIKKHYKHHFNF